MFHEIVGANAEPIKNPVVVLEKDGTGRIEELVEEDGRVPHVGSFAALRLAGRRVGRGTKELMYTQFVAFALGKSFSPEQPPNGWGTIVPEHREAVVAALRTYVANHLPSRGIHFEWRSSEMQTHDSNVRLLDVVGEPRATNRLPGLESMRLATLQDTLWLSSLDEFVCSVVRSAFLDDAMITAHRCGSSGSSDQGLEVRIHKHGPIVGKLIVPLRSSNYGGIAMLVNNAVAGQLDAASRSGKLDLNDFHGLTIMAAFEQSVLDIKHLVHDVLYPYMKATAPTRF